VSLVGIFNRGGGYDRCMDKNQSFHIEGEKSLHGQLGSTTEQSYN